MFGQLIPTGGGLPFPLVRKRVIVGRDPKCDVVVPSRRISSRHCELTLRNGFWWVKDLDSRNGTGIDGKRITEKRILPGEVLCIPRMRFRVEYAAPGASESSDESEALRALNAVDSQSTASTVMEKVEPGARDRTSGTRNDTARPAHEPHLARDSKVPRRLKRPQRLKRPRQHPAPVRPIADTERSVQRRYLGKLVPSGGGDPIPLLEETLTVGRSRSCHVRIKQSTISGRHCLLTWEDGYWFVEDLSSSNGIRVNSEKVDRKILMPGDRLAISKQHFVIEYEAEGPPPRDMNVMSRSLLEKAGLQTLMDEAKQPAWITSHEDSEEPQRKYTLTDNDP